MMHCCPPRSVTRCPLLLVALVAIVLSFISGGLLRSDTAAAQDATTATTAKKTVLITGANRGIGLEFAKQYAEAGWRVIATARDPEAANELKAIKGSIELEALDVADQKSVDAMAGRLKDVPIDLLINNAGISGGGRTVADIDAAEYERVLQVNTIGPMRVTRALLGNLRAGGGKTVVSISSGLGSITQNTRGGNYGYRESKAALNMFMRTIAAELKGEGFICIPMSPGWVQTDMGGANATLKPEQSIAGMRKVIDGLKPEDSGKFWNHDGNELPW